MGESHQAEGVNIIVFLPTSQISQSLFLDQTPHQACSAGTIALKVTYSSDMSSPSLRWSYCKSPTVAPVDCLSLLRFAFSYITTHERRYGYEAMDPVPSDIDVMELVC